MEKKIMPQGDDRQKPLGAPEQRKKELDPAGTCAALAAGMPPKKEAPFPCTASPAGGLVAWPQGVGFGV